MNNRAGPPMPNPTPAKIEVAIKMHVLLDDSFTLDDAYSALREAKQTLNGFGYVTSFHIKHPDMVVPGKDEEL